MKKSILFLLFLLPLTAMAEQHGEIMITGQKPGSEVNLAPQLPAAKFSEFLGMFITADQIQGMTVGPDSVATFKTADYPAYYLWVNVHDVQSEFTIAAMPGDNITVNYRKGEYWPEVSGPKTTLDIFNIQKQFFAPYQEMLKKQYAEGVTEEQKAAALAEYQLRAKELCLANLDNAGGVWAAIRAARSEWPELVKALKPGAYASPLAAPTYWFMVRCVNWNVNATVDISSRE